MLFILLAICVFLAIIGKIFKKRRLRRRSLEDTPTELAPQTESRQRLKNSIITAMEKIYGEDKILSVNLICDNPVTYINYPVTHEVVLNMSDGRNIYQKINAAELR